MSKDLLVHVLTKELGIGIKTAECIADNCSEEQLQAVTSYLKMMSRNDKKHRIDNWDKYAIMMMTAYKSAARPIQPSLAAVKPAKVQTVSRKILNDFLAEN